MFIKHKVNGCCCYDSGDFRIVQQKGKQVFHAYKACSWDDDGKPTGYSSVQKTVLRTESYPEHDERGKPKKDTQGKPIMKDANIMGAKEYVTLESAKTACV